MAAKPGPPKPGKSGGASNKVVKKVHKAAAKIPGMNTKVTPGRAAKRYGDIAFPGTYGKRFEGKKPGGHLMWDKKPGSVAFPKKGKKK